MENQYPVYGGQSSQSQPIFANDEWAYRLAPSLDHLSETNSQVNYELSAQLYQSQDIGNEVAVEEVSCPPTRKGKEVKKVSRRGTDFTKEEDKVLCSAFLKVSKDAITGVNQSHGGYYKRLHEYFNEHKPDGSVRSQVAIQNRWSSIQKAVNKFCGLKSIVDRRNESGKNKYDRIEDARKMFESAEPFQFMHCWEILRNEAKWNDRVLELANLSSGNKVAGGTSTHVVDLDSGNGTTDMQRPKGRDSAKKKRSRGVADTASSTALEVLQRMNENREKCQIKEDEQMQEVLNRKDEKINLQKELLIVHKQEIEIRQQQNEVKKYHLEQDIQLRKKGNELIAKQIEAQLLTAEAGIMAVDIDKIAPHLKNYYIGMQRQIMERRGFVSDGNN